MQAIIASLPERVLNFKDDDGNTIIDDGFSPFIGLLAVNRASGMRPHSIFAITRPHYIMTKIKCKGEKMKVVKKVEGNIQEAINNKVTRIYIKNSCHISYINSFEDDVYKLLDAGHIQVLNIKGDLKSNGKQYHIDFLHNDDIEDNITSYYNYGKETAKTVALRNPMGSITNNLISLGLKYITPPEPYPDTITSKFIKYTNYTNARSKNQDILDMIEALKAKIEAL